MIFEEHAFFYLRELLMCCLGPVELLPWCPPSNMEEPLNRSLKGHECTWTEENANISLPGKQDGLAATRMNYLNINIPVCQALTLGRFT